MGDSRETINTNFNSLYNGLSVVWDRTDTLSSVNAAASLPTVLNYLSTNNIVLSTAVVYSLTATNLYVQVLSAGSISVPVTSFVSVATAIGINSLSTNYIVINDNGSVYGATSATTINFGTILGRTFSLIHSPANDGINPEFNIGETQTGSFSGFKITYNETTNNLVVQASAANSSSNIITIDRDTGRVGISATPNQALTVGGNISATGNIFASNLPTLPTTYYINANRAPFPLSSANTYFDISAAPSLQNNKAYELTYDLYHALSGTGNTTLNYIISTNNILTNIALNGFWAYSAFGNNTLGFTTNSQNVSSLFVSTGVITLPLTASTSIKAFAETLSATTFALFVSGSNGNITPLRGSRRTVTLVN